MKRATLLFAFSVMWLFGIYAQSETATEGSDVAATETIEASSTEASTGIVATPLAPDGERSVPEAPAENAATPAENATIVVEKATVSEESEIRITLDQTEIHIGLKDHDYRDKITLEATVLPENTPNKDVLWASSDRNVVRVNPNGTLTPVKVGSAVITAMTKVGGASASCTVHVDEHGAAPKLDPKITTELEGEASVTFGMDLDTGKGGITRDADVSLVVNILDQGERLTDSNDKAVWGEIRVYTEGDPLSYGIDDKDSGTSPTVDKDFKVVVDYAKIHFGKNVFMSIYDQDEDDYGNISYAASPDVAFHAASADTDSRYGALTPMVWVVSSVGECSAYGFQVGFSNETLFDVTLDIASTKEWDASSTVENNTATLDATDWAYKVAFNLNVIPNLTLGVGYSNAIIGEDTVYLPDIAMGGELGYKWYIFGDFYVKPKVGLTMVQVESEGDLLPLINAGILFGWDDKADAFDYWGMKYTEDDNGAYPGVALAYGWSTKDLNAERTTDKIMMHASFNSGYLVKGLSLVGAVDLEDFNTDEQEIYMTGGLVYTEEFPNDVKVTPKLLATYYKDELDDDNNYAFIKAALKIEPFPHTAFEFNYESNDLIHGFDTGVEYQKLGKFETIVSVSF